MAIRETLNRSQSYFIVGVVIVIIAAGIYIFSQTRSDVPSTPKAYFTIDEGKTFFDGSPNDVPPILKDGKEALKAYVFQNPKTGEKFVGYLERCTAEARPLIIKMQTWKQGDPVPSERELTTIASGHEYRRPTDAKWTKGTDAGAMTYLKHVTCKDGSDAVAVQ